MSLSIKYLTMRIHIIACCLVIFLGSFLTDKDKTFIRVELSNSSYRHIELNAERDHIINDSTVIQLNMNEDRDTLCVDFIVNENMDSTICYLLSDELIIDTVQVYDPSVDEFLFEIYPTYDLIPLE